MTRVLFRASLRPYHPQFTHIILSSDEARLHRHSF